MTQPNPAGVTSGACPLCESELDPARGFVVDERAYAQCRGCHTHVATSLPDAGELETFYRERYYSVFGAVEASPQRLSMLRTLLATIPRRPPGRLLDVGCGAGHLLAMARSAGWDVTGVDPSVEACALARMRYGLDVRPAALEDAGLSQGTFDVVTLINVLDQAPNPVALLEAVRRVIRVKGLVVVRVPNGAFHRTAWRVVRHTPVLMARRLRPLVIFHPFSLDARALKSLLARVGFGSIHVQNAPISAADWSARGGAVGRVALAGVVHAGRAFAAAAAALTAGRLLCAPSLLAFAEREAGQ